MIQTIVIVNGEYQQAREQRVLEFNMTAFALNCLTAKMQENTLDLRKAQAGWIQEKPKNQSVNTRHLLEYKKFICSYIIAFMATKSNGNLYPWLNSSHQ